MRGRESLS